MAECNAFLTRLASAWVFYLILFRNWNSIHIQKETSKMV